MFKIIHWNSFITFYKILKFEYKLDYYSFCYKIISCKKDIIELSENSVWWIKYQNLMYEVSL